MPRSVKPLAKKLNLTKEETKVLQAWCDGWGRLWKDSILRFWRGEKNSLDDLWCNNKPLLMGLKDRLQPVLSSAASRYDRPIED